MVNFFRKLLSKRHQNIDRTTITDSIVIQTHGDFVIDSNLSDQLVLHKNDKHFLNQLIKEKLSLCENLIFDGRAKDASCIIDTIYVSSIKSINDEINDELNYLKAVLWVLSGDTEKSKSLVGRLESSPLYQNNISTIIDLDNNNMVNFVVTNEHKVDHLFIYMFLQVFFNKARWQYIINNFKPTKHSFHIQDYFYGLASFNEQNYVEAVRALNSANAKKTLPKYSFYMSLGQLNSGLETLHEDEMPVDVLESQYQVLIDAAISCPELRDANSIAFNLTRVRTLLFTNPESFLREYSDLSQTQKDDVNFRFQLGTFYQMQKQYEEAIRIYTEISSKDSSAELSHRILLCYLLQNKFYEIIKFFENPSTHKFSATITIYLIAVNNQNPKQFDNLFDKYYFSSCNTVEDLSFFSELFHYSAHAKEEIYIKIKDLKNQILTATKAKKIMLAFFAAEVPDIELSKCFLGSIQNYSQNDLEMAYYLLSRLVEFESRKNITKWFISNDFKTPQLLNVLAECYMQQKKYFSAFSLLRESFAIYRGKNTAFYLINLVALLDTVKIEDIQDCLNFIAAYKEPEILLITAQTYCKFGFYDKAENLSYEAIYLLNNQDNDFLYNLYLSIHFKMINSVSSKHIEYNCVTNDTVVYLKPIISVNKETSNLKPNGESSSLVICINQESELCKDTYTIGALHISKSNILYLKLINKDAHAIIEHDGLSYEIVDIVSKHAHTFRYILPKVDSSGERPLIKKISIDMEKDIKRQMHDVLRELAPASNLLDSYHFKDNPIGLPIEYINRCEYDEYVHIVQSLLYSKDEVLYAGLNQIEYDPNQTYTITLSSLVMLKILDSLSALSNNRAKIFVSSTLLEFIKTRSENASKILVTSPGKIGIDEDGNLILTPQDDSMPDFWNDIYEATLKLNIQNVSDDDRTAFNKLHPNIDLEKLLADPALHICQLDSFIIAQKTNSLLLLDDLFFRRLGNLLNIQSVNHTHLYTEMEKEPYKAALTKLMETNYLYIPMAEKSQSLIRTYIKSISSNERKCKAYAALFPPDSFMSYILCQENSALLDFYTNTE